MPSPATLSPQNSDLSHVEQLLEHFEFLEAQFNQLRQGLTHSHRLTTLGTLASIVAHEYNNILTPVISYAQMALADPADAELMKKAVERALSSAERAAQISSSLLGFAQENDGANAANLPEVAREAVACLARDPEKDGIHMQIDLPDVSAAISPLNLQQVLVNLILNAKKAMRRTGGTIHIACETRDEHLAITVADDGPGIPPEILDRLFEPFVTHAGEDVPGQPRGTGLGLCICRDLIRNAGGEITVDTTQGEGTRFTLLLPRAADETNDPASNSK